MMGDVRVRIEAGWALEQVRPIFGAQSGSGTTSTCVLFGRRTGAAAPPPAVVERWQGALPRRDANEAEAAHALTKTQAPWPRPRTLIGVSPYRDRFRQGATIVPRRFFLTEPEAVSRLAARRDAPVVRGRVGALDKAPWTGVTPPRGPVETQFLRQMALGESVAPFRMLATFTTVIPADGCTLIDSRAAEEAGHRYLAAWLRDVESKWAEYSNKNSDGLPRMTVNEQINNMRKLTSQLGPQGIRVIYPASGTRMCAARVPSDDLIVEHAAYWCTVKSIAESGYLLSILNSDLVIAKIVDLQPRGEVGPRHFDNLVWTLAIPEYDPAEPLHQHLAAAAARAETVAAAVDLSAAAHFTAKRRAIRAALAEAGVAQQIEALVDALLPP